MLIYNPKNRITCKEALNHRYFNDKSFIEKNTIASQINFNTKNKDGIEGEFHEYSTKNKPQVKDVIKKQWITEEYYSYKDKNSEAIYLESLVNATNNTNY